MRSILIVAALALSVTAAHAGDVMASRYGNTTITTDASGVQTKLYYNADGTFTGKQGTFGFTGTWKLDGNTICLTFNPAPPGAPNPTCTPVSAHKVGDTWSGGGRTITLVQGIQ
jgi:YD repeat-containing protein